MSSSDEYLNLSTLPFDIIRKITENVGPLTFDDVRLISPEWNAIVVNHLSDRKRLPISDWLKLSITGLENSVLFQTIEAQSYSFSYSDETKALNRVAFLLGRCSRIKKLEIDIRDFDNIAIATNSMLDLNIEELIIIGREYFDLRFQNVIMNFLRSSGRVTRLVILFHGVDAVDSEDELFNLVKARFFFVAAALLVDEVEAVHNVLALERLNRFVDIVNIEGNVTARLVTVNQLGGRVAYRSIINRRSIDR